MSTATLRNIGPKSAAWLRQVGLRTPEDLAAAGTIQAFLKVRRAGFKPSLNLLYALEGALLDCHWHDVPDARRQQLLAELETATAAQPPARGQQAAGPVTTAWHASGQDDDDAPDDGDTSPDGSDED